MKGFITVLVIIGVVAGGWWLLSREETSSDGVVGSVVSATPDTSTPEPLRAVTVSVPESEQSVTLENGSGSVEAAPGSVEHLDVVLLNNQTQTVGSFLVAPFTISTGGTGLFTYVISFDKETLEQVGTALVGDRIDPLDLKSAPEGSVADLTFTYLDRLPDEPMVAAPTVTRTVSYQVAPDGSLEVVEVPSEDEGAADETRTDTEAAAGTSTQ